MNNRQATVLMVIVYSLAAMIGYYTIQAAKLSVQRMNQMSKQVEMLQQRVDYMDQLIVK